jgi:hypothetical protein
MQDRLINLLGPNAYPFFFEVSTNRETPFWWWRYCKLYCNVCKIVFYQFYIQLCSG